MGFPPLARRHSCEFSEICVEVAAVAVADGFADSFRFHLGVFQQHPAGIIETESVSPLTEIHPVLTFHEGAHGRRVGVEILQYVFIWYIPVSVFSGGDP